MQTFMLNPERELSVEYLLDHVWRQEPKEGPDTVSLYVSYLKGKLKWVGSKATIVQKNGNFGLKATE